MPARKRIPVRTIARAGLLNPRGEGVGREVHNLLTAVDELTDQRQRGVGVPVEREAEEEALAMRISDRCALLKSVSVTMFRHDHAHGFI